MLSSHKYCTTCGAASGENVPIDYYYEKNAMIAIFDGYRIITDHPEFERAFCLHPTINVGCVSIDELDYHNDDSLLLPVVRTIKKGIEMKTYPLDYRSFNQNDFALFSLPIHSDRRTVWSKVCEFIEWYNINQRHDTNNPPNKS
ncbi:MAG TPA: hypothetical protein VEA58_01255 [Anaerovoracaceae bacterium]|nr:hypothetical protein [Anaerovoracaceae bacterium]